MVDPVARRRSPPIERDLLATAALFAFTMAVAAGFARVFSGWRFVGDLLLVALVAHTAAFGFRRVRVPGLLAAPATLLLSLWVLAWQHVGDSFSLLFPSGTSFDIIERDLQLVRDQFPTAVAPVIYETGWPLLAGFAIALVATTSDAFAFRAHGRGESLVPGVVVFIFVAALGSPRLRVELTVALVAVGILAVVALRALERPGRVLRSTRSISFAAPAAFGIALTVALVAGVVGPDIPGAGAEPIYETKGRGNSRTLIVSPLVDIRSRLTNQGNLELFRVNSPTESYWRVTTLPEFDGVTFKLPARPLEQLDDDTAATIEQDVSTGRRIEVRQQVQVISLTGQTIPAAPDPYQAAGQSADDEPLTLRINRDTSTLIAPESIATGDVFTIVSAVPTISADQLSNASSSTSPDPLHLALPDDLPAQVAETAAAVAGDQLSGYDQALALQSFFRNNFEYSLEVQSGHGTTAIEAFLDNRVGYCEQFAATFAAMARTLGLPSRVAVGYTSGVLGDDGWYSVRGKNAHAWPEIWFDDVGWVSFEPTPGRGAPGTEQYTGVPAQQDTTGVTDVPDERAVPDTTPEVETPPTLPGSNTVPPVNDGQLIPDADGPGNRQPPTQAGAAANDGGSSVPWRSLGLIALVALIVASPALVRRFRRLTEERMDGPERTLTAWRRALRAVSAAGVPADPSYTTGQWVAASSEVIPVSTRPLQALGSLHDQVVFGDREVDNPSVSLWADQLEKMADDSMTPLQRVRLYFTNWS